MSSVFRFLPFLLLLLSHLAHSQNRENPEVYIKELYGSNFDEIRNNNPLIYNIWVELLDNRIEIIQTSTVEKFAQFPLINSIPLRNKFNDQYRPEENTSFERFNPLMYELDFFSEKVNYYRINDSGLILIINPQSR